MIEDARSVARPLTLRTRLKHWLIRFVVEVLFRVSQAARYLPRFRRANSLESCEVLLTGTFHSSEWITAFLQPLAMAQSCRKVVLVTTLAVLESDGITIIHPPQVLRRIIGDVPARLLTFAWQAIKSRPDLVGGFHISINALVAQAVASLVGSRSMYVCVGGPIEVLDGGLWGESRFFGKLDRADPVIEAKLLRAVRRFDAVVLMGAKAGKYFSEHGVSPKRLFRITGGVDSSRFGQPRKNRTVDLIFVGRLVPIKSLDLLLATVNELVKGGRKIRARIVGSGPMEQELKELTCKMGIENHVEFAGFVPDVIEELENAKCFVLTSRSEGLSLAMIEAMLAGAVPVVADVGDLGDLVEDGVNGILVDSRDPNDFALCIDELLGDENKLLACSQVAYNTAIQCSFEFLADDWNALLSTFNHAANAE